MKIVLTGATGNTGSHALTRLLSLPAVTRVVILSRRPLSPAIDSPKIETVVLTDAEFLEYPPRVVDALKGASGAVWTLGKLPQQTPEGLKEAEKIVVGYTTALMRAVVSNPPAENGEPFRLAFTSGGLIPEDPNAKLWFAAPLRKMGAEAMEKFHAYAAENASKLDVVICKPWFIRPPNAGFSLFSFLPSLQIPVDVLAAALVDIAVNGSEGKNLRNEELKAKGVAALAKSV